MVHIQAENIIKRLQIALCYLVHYPSEVPSLVYIKPCMLGEICKLVWDFLFSLGCRDFRDQFSKDKRPSHSDLWLWALFLPFLCFPRSGAVREFGGQTRNMFLQPMKWKTKVTLESGALIGCKLLSCGWKSSHFWHFWHPTYLPLCLHLVSSKIHFMLGLKIKTGKQKCRKKTKKFQRKDKHQPANSLGSKCTFKHRWRQWVRGKRPEYRALVEGRKLTSQNTQKHYQNKQEVVKAWRWTRKGSH